MHPGWSCRLLLGSILILPLWAFGTSPTERFDPGWAPFVATITSPESTRTILYREFAVFHPPEEEVALHVAEAVSGEYRLHIDGELQPEEAPGGWRWHTPAATGLQRLEISHRDGPGMKLNLFVETPLDRVRDGTINGYRIGHYPPASSSRPAIHQPPAGLVEVTEDMVDLAVSPHFRLGQFLCKQQPGHWPKYLVLQSTLVEKLELLLAEMNRQGIRTDSLHVMSGYRTPWYNQSIGNVRFSRHVWGAGADIFVDRAGDGRMDDLTGDGSSDVTEARILQRIVEEALADQAAPSLVGGLGLYGPRPHRGPFIHVDVRGARARWESP